MLFKICLLCCMAILAQADNSIENASDVSKSSSSTPNDRTISSESRVQYLESFETSHKRPGALEGDVAFQTSHKIGGSGSVRDLRSLQNIMTLLPTKERPELNPILSALINEDVMKSIEAKRAIEKAELEQVKAEHEAVLKVEEQKKKRKKAIEGELDLEKATEAPQFVLLTTVAPLKKVDLENDDNDLNGGFIDQTISLDEAGTENNKKSRIEIKKGPNGQDYEYEYVYYYEDEDDDSAKAKSSIVETPKENGRGKNRYTNIERSTAASPPENSLVKGKSKGRSSSAVVAAVDEVEPERLPTNTRFPSRGKNIDVHPTPSLDSVESSGERKKISVKRPSLELVDSQTFNTDEKQAKGSRESDSKSVNALEQEEAVRAAALAAAKVATEINNMGNFDDVGTATVSSIDDSEIERTTLPMEKAALDLYAILANENFNIDMSTESDLDVTTNLPGTTNTDGADGFTTLIDEELNSTPVSSTTSTTTTTTTTTEAPTTTTTTTAAPSLFGGKRPPFGANRNRYSLKKSATPTTTTTEAPVPSETPKTVKNRYSRPQIGGRTRIGGRTTTAAPATSEEEKIEIKEVKPVSSGFSRNRPRNRFNLRGSTTEKPAEDDGEGNPQEETLSSSTSRPVRVRPTLNLRGRSRITTTKAPVSVDEANPSGDTPSEDEQKPAVAVPARPSRFNINRTSGNRLPTRGKFSRTTAAPATEDSAADSSHHNDIKGDGVNADTDAGEKSDAEGASPGANSLNRLKSRPRLHTLHKTEPNARPKAGPAALAPRKINPLLAKRRLPFGQSTTEAANAEAEASSTSGENSEAKDETAATADADSDSSKDDTTEETETTTKQARGLGLLGQRRRLPLRKPGTIL